MAGVFVNFGRSGSGGVQGDGSVRFVAGNLGSSRSDQAGAPLGPAPRQQPPVRGGLGLNLASRTQVSGHFFLRRRLGFALLRRSVRMEVDPVRWQRVLLMLSAVLAAILVIGGFVVGFFRPAGQITDSTKIVAERKTGTSVCGG